MKKILLLWLLCSGTCFGYPDVSQDFADYCGPIADAAPGEIYQWKDARVERVRWCFGYMKGLWEGISGSPRETGNSPSLGRYSKLYDFCLVGQAAIPINEEAIRVVVKYIRKHPERPREMIATSVIFAFREVYPCPKDSIPDKQRK